jgi:SpoVK/Ycf46/Vps4 family AAA+-type ATPase
MPNHCIASGYADSVDDMICERQRDRLIVDLDQIERAKGILIYGPSGCGKTYCVNAFAAECHVNFVAIKGYDGAEVAL